MKNRILLKYHSWFGLISGIFLILMGVSGAILVFQHDIENELWKEYISVENSGEFNIDEGIRTIQQEYKNWDTRLIHFQKGEALIFNLRRPTERLFVFVHPGTGEIIKEINELTTFTRWLLKFHYSFQAGLFGRILVFIVGILFFLSLLTGIYLYRRSIFKVLLLREKINFRNKRGLNSSLHRIVGVWSLLLNLLLVITGTVLSYTVVMAALAEQKIPQTPQVATPVKDILLEMENEYPNFTPTYIGLPRAKEGTINIYGIYDSDPFYFSEFYNSFGANYFTGEITSVTKISEADLQTKFMSTLIPLHFGNFGGIWTKLLYCFIGLTGPLLSITGFIIWQKASIAKRKKKKRKETKMKKKYPAL